MVDRFDIYLVCLDPTMGSEIKKTRPCVIISPNVMNKYLDTVIIAPMTTMIRGYPSRVSITFQGKKGDVALDQMRAIDKNRLVKKIGVVHSVTSKKIIAVTQDMFA